MKTQDILFSLFILSIVIVTSSCSPNTILDEQTAANTNSFTADTQTYLLRDTAVKVMWHTKSNDAIGTTVFNSDYLDTMSDPERAAIGFVSAFIRTDTGMRVNYSKGGRKLIPLLLFEQKANEKKISFLKQWFRYDKECLDKLESASAFCDSQKEFEEINLIVNTDTITVLFTAKENTSEGITRWRQEDTFKLDQNNLHLIEEKQSEIN